METKRYEVLIKLIGNQSPCHIGHKIGDEWVFDYMTPGGICSLTDTVRTTCQMSLDMHITSI